MLGEGAAYVLGIEPVRQYVEQFRLLSAFAGTPSGAVLPLGIGLASEDEVFRYGVFDGAAVPSEAPCRGTRDALVSGGEVSLDLSG